MGYGADGDGMVLSVEGHAMNELGASAAAIREVAKIYPLLKFEVEREPRESG